MVAMAKPPVCEPLAVCEGRYSSETHTCILSSIWWMHQFQECFHKKKRTFVEVAPPPPP